VKEEWVEVIDRTGRKLYSKRHFSIAIERMHFDINPSCSLDDQPYPPPTQRM
jgi:hypothetical protein